jgi:hypothetical protein
MNSVHLLNVKYTCVVPAGPCSLLTLLPCWPCCPQAVLVSVGLESLSVEGLRRGRVVEGKHCTHWQGEG